MNYEPKPIDTSDVRLDPALDGLVEALAENVHDVWAQGRLAQGWSYGERRDDVRKLHPCLVPYGELPESEKKYDRDSAVSTLKLIAKMGYGIVKSMPKSSPQC